MNWEFVNKDLHIQAQRIIINIYSCLRDENSTLSETNIVIRICELTKIARSTVLRVIAAGDVIDHSVKRQRVGQNLKKIDKATRDVICRFVYEFYQDNKVPTLEMLQAKLKICPDYPYKSLDTLRRALIECGFNYKKLDKRMVIMESTRIVIQRQHYLRKIKEYRDDNRDIVYLDETWFDTHDVVQYGWMDGSKKCCLSTPCSRGKRILILHVGTKDGFVPNALLLSSKNIKQSSADYHEDMTAELFEKWATEQLLPNIKTNSVIVMDNAPYHSRLYTKIPNTSSKKGDIIEFMENKGMTIPSKCTKKELLQLIKQQNLKKEYAVDKLFERHGHMVLRLPPYHCVFNPTEMVWADVKNKLRKMNQSPQLSDVVVQNIRTVIEDLNKTNIWKNCVAHVQVKENEYVTLPPIQPIVINPNDDSSSEQTDSD
ncbi:uncharacterized protein LOC126891360 [Diabrotica virgifera virgifera]|nr:uncharacterized protein LOC126891360 [Diabrotica virgifera virgifera]